MNEIQNLLTQVSLITKKNNEILDASGGRFNMFGLLGVDHYENTHSAIISEFLNPQGSHGLKNKPLKVFIKQLSKYNQKCEKLGMVFKAKTAQAITEYPTSRGRIDILIEDNHDHAIIIENKIYAEDQWEQLKRYNEYALEKYKAGNYLILYLTLSGTEASEQSCKGVDYIQVSHANFIIEWLEKCVALAVRFPLVRETIIQYINYLKRLTNQDMNTKNSEELVKIMISSDNNILASLKISQNIGKMKEMIIERYFNPQMFEIANELKINYTDELKDNKIYSGFSFANPQWKFFKIKFEFDGADYMKLGYMFSLVDINKKPENSISQLHSKFSNHNNNESIPCGWSYMSKFRDWNDDAFVAIISGEMKNEIKKAIQRMIEISKELEI